MMNFDLCDLRQFPLSNTDMVTVISNLLDNAIRAAAQADPPQINVRIKQMDGEYVVSVRNRVREDVPLHGDELPASTKQEPGTGWAWPTCAAYWSAMAASTPSAARTAGSASPSRCPSRRPEKGARRPRLGRGGVVQ